MNHAIRILAILALVGIGGFVVYSLFSSEGTEEGVEMASGGPAEETEKELTAPTVDAPETPKQPEARVRSEVEVPKTELGIDVSTGGGGISGRIIDRTSQAVTGAEVRLFIGGANATFNLPTLREDTGRKEVTDEDGVYMFDNLPARNDYVVVANHPDFAQGERAGITTVESGPVPVPDIVLDNGVRVYGIVFQFPEGVLQGARVELWDTLSNSFKPEEEKQPFAVTHTDDQGQYEFKNVHFSACEVVASYDGFATVTKSKHTLFAPVADIELQFELVRAVEMRGVVVDTRGAPIVGAKVTAFQVGQPVAMGGAKGTALSIHDGSFRISGLAKGNYNVSASAVGFSDKQAGTFEAEANDIRIVMEERGCATGTVTASDGGRVDTFSIRAMSVRGETDPIPTRITQVFERTNGQFSVCDLDPGRYLLQASAKGYADSRSEPFFVERGQTVQNLSIALTKGATVTGVVVDGQGQPVAGAEVKLNQNNFVPNPFIEIFGAMAPKGQRIVQPKTRTGKDGSFTLELVVPGTYQLSVSAKGFSPFVVNDLLLDDSQTRDVGRSTLSRGGSIVGECLDSAGRPYAEGTVNCTGENGKGFQTVRTDYDGRFEILNLEPGEYKLTLNPGDKVNGEPINPILKVIQAQKTEKIVYVDNDRTVEVQLMLPPPQGN